MDLYLFILEIIGTIAFATSGAMIAIRNKMDILGVMLLGSATAIGGGMIRDIVIGREILSVFENPIYFFIAVGTTILFFIPLYFMKNIEFAESKYYTFTLNAVDAVGLGVFVIVGANVALNLSELNYLLVIFCSVITAVGGGIIRDIMVNIIPGVFRKHIYAVAALVGCGVYLVFDAFNLNMVGAILSILTVVVIRMLSYFYKWSLPKVFLK